MSPWIAASVIEAAIILTLLIVLLYYRARFEETRALLDEAYRDTKSRRRAAAARANESEAAYRRLQDQTYQSHQETSDER